MVQKIWKLVCLHQWGPNTYVRHLPCPNKSVFHRFVFEMGMLWLLTLLQPIPNSLCSNAEAHAVSHGEGGGEFSLVRPPQSKGRVVPLPLVKPCHATGTNQTCKNSLGDTSPSGSGLGNQDQEEG